MIPIEITLVILGIVAIVLSYFLSEKVTSKTKTLNSGETTRINFTDNDSEIVKHKINEILLESTEDVIDKTDDQLSKISNEKIMVVSEFSDQVLEKINQNHQEVIFLYNMLNDKDTEIKETLKQIQALKYMEKEVEILEDANESADDEKTIESIAFKEENEDEIVNSKNVVAERKLTLDENQDETMTQNNNEIILEYHKQGMTIMEISRNLGLGQGEVKLVIDLFQGEKK